MYEYVLLYVEDTVPAILPCFIYERDASDYGSMWLEWREGSG